MSNDYWELMSYHYILTDYQLCDTITPKFFKYGGGKLARCFSLAKDYLMKYKTAPTETDMVDLVKMNNLEDQIPEGFIRTIYVNKDSYKESDKKWLYDRVVSWAKSTNLENSLTDAALYFKKMEDSITIENVDDVVERTRSILNSGLAVDFTNSQKKGKHLWNAADHKQEHMKRRSTGYPFIDMCLGGGYWNGSFIVFAGQPKIGKSNFLCNLAVKSIKAGYNVAYISLELPEEMILARIGANMFHVPIANYESFASNEVEMEKRMNQYRMRAMVPPGELYVKSYPTSTLTSMMLEAELLAEEERMSLELNAPFHFNMIVLDYLNIMQNWRNPNSENTYMKIKQLAEDTKAIGVKNDWNIVTATQTNRQQADSNDMKVSDIAESHALLATVDCMFGICADTMMKSQGYYYLKCLADRVSPEENKRKKFIIDKSVLCIIEDPDSGIVEVTSAVDNEISKNREMKNRRNRMNENVQNVSQSPPTSVPIEQMYEDDVQEHTPNLVDEMLAQPDGHNLNPNVGKPMSIFDTSMYNGGVRGSIFRNRSGFNNE